MSLEEKAKEYDRIHDAIFPKIWRRIDISKIHRYIVKHKHASDIWLTDLKMRYKVDNNVTFIAIPYIKDYKTFKAKGPTINCYLFYIEPEGRYTLVRGGQSDNLYDFYTPHLIDRYRERFLTDKLQNKDYATLDFLKSAKNGVPLHLPTKKFPNNYIKATTKGLIFGEKINDRIMLYKTFITKEQLFSNQIDTYIESVAGIEDIIRFRGIVENIQTEHPELTGIIHC